ncbi:MAG: hypothetical protein NZ555_17780 [Geminicoccaceae bacterium]|nr:hypothetical protein [Geminicoccaceae bacterium]
MDEKTEALRTYAALAGVAIPQARIGAIAETLARQLAAERAATGTLEFEVEPSSFVATLARSAS